MDTLEAVYPYGLRVAPAAWTPTSTRVPSYPTRIQRLIPRPSWLLDCSSLSP